MVGNWIDPEVIERTLRDEAGRRASGLGHRMTGWVAVPAHARTFMSRCVVCSDAVTIAVRQLRSTPIAGAAVALRCRTHK